MTVTPLALLQSIHPLTQEAWDDLKPLLEPLSLKRSEYLIQAGEVARYCYILTEGVVRVFYNKEGNEYNKTFFVSGTFPTPLTALISGTPCAISFQALVPGQALRFSYQAFRDLFKSHRCLESLFRVILEQIWIKKERHDIHMVTNDATTNYHIFQQEFPTLENQIPQYHIASYLGITPIQLSRIRAQLAKSN